MVASRYAVSIEIPNYSIRDLPPGSGYMEHVKGTMRAKLGRDMFSELEESNKPFTIALQWLTYPRVDSVFDTCRIALVATVYPVQQVRMVMPEMPELAYQPIRDAVRLDGDHLFVEWQCAYCGQTNLIKEHLECRRCGAPRKPMR